MTTIPEGTQFVGISSDVNLIERKSARQNAKQAIYTIEDIRNSSGTGWALYNDGQYTEGSPFSVLQGNTESLPNNKAVVIEDYLPDGITSLYNGTVITPENVGDYYTITVRFAAKTTAPNGGYFDFSIDLGGAVGQQFKESLLFTKGAGIEQYFSINIPCYSLDTFVANGGTIKIKSGSGNTTIYNIRYQIARTYKSVP